MELHRQAVEAAGLPVLLRSGKLVRVELEGWTQSSKRVYRPNLMALYREHELLLSAWSSGDAVAAELAVSEDEQLHAVSLVHAANRRGSVHERNS